MNSTHLTTVTVSVALVVSLGLLSGCQSAPRGFPKLPREPAFSGSGEREDFEIRVQVSPVKGVAHWYKMESVFIQKNAGQSNSGYGRVTMPTLQAPVGASAVSYQGPGTEPGTGPRVWFKVYEQEGKLIAEYEIGYTAKEGDSFTRKGLLRIKTSDTD